MPEPSPAADRAAHWNAAYASRGVDGVSWYRPGPGASLDLVRAAGVDRSVPVIDVGGGASVLVDALLADGFADVTVLDVSVRALAAARRRVGHDAPVAWVVADVLTWAPPRRYGVWHDRAVFHFLVDPGERERYRHTLAAALEPGGIAVVGTFAADGPETCSGLPVRRYGPEELLAELGPSFVGRDQRREEHVTPWGAVQPFTWVVAERRPD